MMERENLVRRRAQLLRVYRDRNSWMWSIEGVMESLVIEDPSAESWNSAYEKLAMNWDVIRDPELTCQFLFKKIKEVGCREKKAAWNIAWFISFCLNRFFKLYQYKITLETCEDRCDEDYYRSHVCKFHLFRDIYRPKSELDFFKFLLNYGFFQPIDIDSEYNIRQVTHQIRWLAYIPEMEQRNDETAEKIARQAQDLVPKLRSSDEKFKGAFQRGFKRLMLTFTCVRALEQCHRYYGDDQYYAQCMRLYFRGVTDPFVQAEEVREYLSFFLVDAKEEEVDATVTVFQSLFPESKAPYGPRSLQHLCRCQVREVLSPKSEVLPELVKHLKIPLKMKKYILGDF